VSTVWNGVKAGASAVTKAVTKVATSVGNGIAKAAAAVRPALAEAVEAVTDTAQSAAAFYERNKTQINAVVASATVGLVAYAGCTAMSFGTGAVACAGVAGAAGGAVYGAMTCPEGTSRTQCAAVGAVSGALGGVTAGSLAAAGVGLAGVGAGSAAASNVADQVMRTGEVDPKELLVSTLAGGAVGGLGGALGRAAGGPRASSLADDFLPGRTAGTPTKPSTSPAVKTPAPKTEPRTVAIGEDMEGRVIPFAQRNGADWYKPAPDAPQTMWMENNRRWINDRMDEGCRILDCGAAPGRPNHPRATSPYYQMELDEIAKRGYPDYSRVDID
jgi:hypothetical protein